MVADCEGISADDDGGDRGKVVRVKGLGRGAAESMLGGVMPRGALCGLGERLEEVRRITGGERAPVDSVASWCTMFPFASASR